MLELELWIYSSQIWFKVSIHFTELWTQVSVSNIKNNFSFFAFFHAFPFRTFNIFVAFPWTLSNSFMSFLYCGAQIHTQHSKWGCTVKNRVEQSLLSPFWMLFFCFHLFAARFLPTESQIFRNCSQYETVESTDLCNYYFTVSCMINWW